MKGSFHDKVKIFGQELKNKTKKIAPSFICLVVLFSSSFAFMASAAFSGYDVITGKTTEQGSGTKSPGNPYLIQGFSDGLPSGVELYGDGITNDEYDPKTGVLIRRWKRLELDGTENWILFGTGTSGVSRMALSLLDALNVDNQNELPHMLCSHYPTVSPADTWLCVEGASINFGSSYLLFMFDESKQDILSWKSWLSEQKAAGNPVSVVYRLREPVYDYVNNDKHQGFKLSGSTLSSNPPAAFDDVEGISYLRLEDDTTYMGWWLEDPFSLNYQLNNGGQYFQLSGGNKYTFSFSFSDSRVNTYSGVSISLDLHLTSLDGSRETIVSQPAYIDGNDFYFSFDYTAEEGVVCKWITLYFSFGSTEIADCCFTLNKASIITNISPETPLYSPPDTGELDNMEGLEGQVNNQNQQGMNNAEGYQDSALTTIVKYVAGFQAVAAIIGKIGDIPFIGALLTLSVSIGLFAFLLGMVGSVYRSRNQGDAQVKREPSTTIFTKWRGGK